MRTPSSHDAQPLPDRGRSTRHGRAKRKLALAANIILVNGVFLWCAVLAHAVRSAAFYAPGAMHKYYFAAAMGVCACLVGLRLRPDLRVDFVLATIVSIIGVYLVEIALAIAAPVSMVGAHVRAAQAEGMTADERTGAEVARDLRRRGTEAYPYVSPASLIPCDGLRLRGARVFPFGGVAGRTIVLGNETGVHAKYLADEHGFNNPSGAFSLEHTHMAIVGDSYAHGWCVSPGEDIAGCLRAGTEVTAINLGAGGAGPLIELAIMKEYATSLRPQAVLWCYFELNDLIDLSRELGSTLLAKYLAPGFSQRLMARQTEVDEALILYVQQAEDQQIDMLANRTRAGKVLKLSHLRRKLGFDRSHYAPPTDDLFGQFSSVLKMARELTESWGGRFYFVYLPVWHRYAEDQDPGTYCHRDRVLALVRDLGIPIIDVCEAFGRHPDALSLFPFRILGHYNAQGYGLIGEAILAHLGH